MTLPTQRFTPTPEAIQAVLAAIVLQNGEPLIDPNRIVYSIGRPAIEAAAGRPLQFEYIQDELNPFGKLNVILQG